MRSDKFREQGKIIHDVYPHTWGFILPCESPVVWEQQTNGVCCNHVYIEGVFLPLHKPILHTYNEDKSWTSRDLLKELQRANYKGKPDGNIWDEINERMHFKYEEIDAPEGQPRNQEGIQWIILKEFESGWGHGSEIQDLIGMTLCLVYPNCD